MTIINHTLGFPRVGLRRELKKAQESYWAGNISREELLAVGRELRFRLVRPCSDHQPVAWQRAGSSSEQRRLR